MQDGTRQKEARQVQEPQSPAQQQIRHETQSVEQRKTNRVSEPGYAADGQLQEPGYGHGV
jgi:hypothetical protein